MRAFAPKAYANKDNSDKCPIQAYKLYKSYRPSNYLDDESPFYVAINHSWTPKSRYCWYKNTPMGPKTLGSVMKVLAENAGLTDKKISNHSVRHTMCTTLLQEGVAPNIIAQLSGHKNIGSLQHYSIASTSQQKDMSNILQGIKKPKQTPSCTISRPIPPSDQPSTPATPTTPPQLHTVTICTLPLPFTI